MEVLGHQVVQGLADLPEALALLDQAAVQVLEELLVLLVQAVHLALADLQVQAEHQVLQVPQE